jgi:hypothetical protein
MTFDAHTVLRQRIVARRTDRTELVQILRDTKPSVGVSSLDLDRSRKGRSLFLTTTEDIRD